MRRAVSDNRNHPILMCVSGIWARFKWWFDFRLKPISANDRAAPKYVVCFKNAEK